MQLKIFLLVSITILKVSIDSLVIWLMIKNISYFKNKFIENNGKPKSFKIWLCFIRVLVFYLMLNSFLFILLRFTFFPPVFPLSNLDGMLYFRLYFMSVHTTSTEFLEALAITFLVIYLCTDQINRAKVNMIDEFDNRDTARETRKSRVKSS